MLIPKTRNPNQTHSLRPRQPIRIINIRFQFNACRVVNCVDACFPFALTLCARPLPLPTTSPHQQTSNANDFKLLISYQIISDSETNGVPDCMRLHRSIAQQINLKLMINKQRACDASRSTRTQTHAHTEDQRKKNTHRRILQASTSAVAVAHARTARAARHTHLLLCNKSPA